MPRHSVAISDQSDLFVPAPKLPEGFAYRDDIISPIEEQAMIERFEELPFQPFEFHGFLGKRRVVSFGWRYDFSGRALRHSDPIPPFLLPLRKSAADFSGVSEDGLQQILINEYAPGAGIGWHRDRPMFEEVVGISFGAPCILRLRRKWGADWQRAVCNLRPRSAYLLRGPSRQEWEHSVPPVDRLRYSVTFRNFTGAGRPKAGLP
jgi:alkylated DNA repair dioxygenase AlkB